MKIRLLFLAVMTMFAFSACTFIPEPPYEFPTINGDEGDDLPPEGSIYTVTQALKAYDLGMTGTKSVKGYIVGAMNSNNNYTAEFGSTSVVSNILLSDDANENNADNCLIVQLSSGTDIRTVLNLKDNPGNYKKEVVVTGSLEKYFNAAGLKNLTGYELDGVAPEGPTTPETPADAYINETFATSLGNFTTKQTLGEYPWVNEYSCAKVSAYVSNTNNAAESWLISPTIDLTNESEAYISFDYVICYTESGKVKKHNQLLISNNYSDNVETADWTAIDFTPTENTSWKFANSGKLAIPAEFIGKSNVTIAFKYTATTTKAGTFEVKNLIVASGKGDTPATPDTPSSPETPESPTTPIVPEVPEGENLLSNGGFETWSDNNATDWGVLTNISTATIQKSTDKCEGEYSVVVNGSKDNRRFASKTYTLDAGTYSLVAYVKANGSDAGYCRLGYVPVKDGTSNGNYKYESQTASAAPEEWTPRVFEFTLKAQTDLVFLIMNHMNGNGASFLIDDVRLIKEQ